VVVPLAAPDRVAPQVNRVDPVVVCLAPVDCRANKAAPVVDLDQVVGFPEPLPVVGVRVVCPVANPAHHHVRVAISQPRLGLQEG
jgi:hypothetical protein